MKNSESIDRIIQVKDINIGKNISVLQQGNENQTD